MGLRDCVSGVGTRLLWSRPPPPAAVSCIRRALQKGLKASGWVCRNFPPHEATQLSCHNLRAGRRHPLPSPASPPPAIPAACNPRKSHWGFPELQRTPLGYGPLALWAQMPVCQHCLQQPCAWGLKICIFGRACQQILSDGAGTPGGAGMGARERYRLTGERFFH